MNGTGKGRYDARLVTLASTYHAYPPPIGVCSSLGGVLWFWYSSLCTISMSRCVTVCVITTYEARCSKECSNTVVNMA